LEEEPMTLITAGLMAGRAVSPDALRTVQATQQAAWLRQVDLAMLASMSAIDHTGPGGADAGVPVADKPEAHRPRRSQGGGSASDGGTSAPARQAAEGGAVPETREGAPPSDTSLHSRLLGAPTTAVADARPAAAEGARPRHIAGMVTNLGPALPGTDGVWMDGGPRTGVRTGTSQGPANLAAPGKTWANAVSSVELPLVLPAQPLRVVSLAGLPASDAQMASRLRSGHKERPADGAAMNGEWKKNGMHIAARDGVVEVSIRDAGLDQYRSQALVYRLLGEFGSLGLQLRGATVNGQLAYASPGRGGRAEAPLAGSVIRSAIHGAWRADAGGKYAAG
jgi:hypothetical protein